MTTAMDPDCEQALLAQAGRDLAAFERLYNHYFPRVYAYVCYRVGSVPDSEDLVADIFLKAVEAIRRGRFAWRHSGSFAAWLFRIAHNAVIDHARRTRGQSAHVPLDALPDEPAAGQPEDRLLRQEQHAHLRSLMALLPPRRQETILLKFFGGLQNREIAVVLGLDERTVASHLSRGLADLHRMFLDESNLVWEAPP